MAHAMGYIFAPLPGLHGPEDSLSHPSADGQQRRCMRHPPFLLRDAAHLLHARHGTRQSFGPRSHGEAGFGLDRTRFGSTSRAAAPAASVQPGELDTAKIAQIVGHEGEKLGSVCKITVGRDDIDLREMGAKINARMGLNTWASFVGTNERAAIAGDVAMMEKEVTPVLKALRKNGLEVVAIHHHMIGSRPTVIFLHYWGQGLAEQLAKAFRAALDQTPAK